MIFHFAPSTTVQDWPACIRQFTKERDMWSDVNEPEKVGRPCVLSCMELELTVPLSSPSSQTPPSGYQQPITGTRPVDDRRDDECSLIWKRYDDHVAEEPLFR